MADGNENNKSGSYRVFLNQNPTTEERLAVYPVIVASGKKVLLLALDESEPIALHNLITRCNRRFFGRNSYGGGRNGLPFESSTPWHYFNSAAMRRTGAVSRNTSHWGQRELVGYTVTDFGEDVAKPLFMRGTRLISELYEQNMRLFTESGLRPEDIKSKKDYMQIPGFTSSSIAWILPRPGSSIDRRKLFLEVVGALYGCRDSVVDPEDIAGMLGVSPHESGTALRSLNQTGFISQEPGNPGRLMVNNSLVSLYEVLVDPWVGMVSLMGSMAESDGDGWFIDRERLRATEEYQSFAHVYDDEERYREDLKTELFYPYAINGEFWWEKNR